MSDERAVDKETVVWWEELKHYKKDNWCCNILKEGSIEEHLKVEFDDLLPVKFGVNYCCECGSPVKEGLRQRKSGKEDWCCRVMRILRFDRLEFSGAGKETATIQVKYCFHCGKELKKSGTEDKNQKSLL